MPEPTLSVLLPNYNHAAYITRAIEAIMAQSRLPDELIILDDGSSDDSVEVIEGLVRRFPLIRLLRNETNTGIGRALPATAAAATSTFIYGAAADDRVLPGFFESAMEMAAAHPETGIILGKYVLVDADGTAYGEESIPGWDEPRFATPEQVRREYLDRAPAGHSLCAATIYRREPLQAIGGFRPELGSWADTFAARCLAMAHGACYVPRPFVEWTQLPTSAARFSRSRPRHMLDITARAVRLMRSPLLRDRFPADFVNDWSQRQREEVIRHAWSSVLRQAVGAAEHAARPELVGAIARHPLAALTSLPEAWRLKRELEHYPGDTSCLDGSPILSEISSDPGAISGADAP